MAIRHYSSTAPETTLQSGVNNVSTTILVGSTVGFPVTTPYTLAIDYGAATEEVVDVTNVAGNSLTITRAVDGTSASSHGAGAKVRHVSSARDFREANEHVNATSNVHGVTGNLVGTTSTQTLTNKTINSPVINDPTMTEVLVQGNSASTVVLDVTASGAIQSQPLFRVRTFAGDVVAQAQPNGSAFQMPIGANVGEHLQVTGSTANTNTPILSVDNSLIGVFSVDDQGDVFAEGQVVADEFIETGTAWNTYTPTWTSSGAPGPAIGNGTIQGRYKRRGKDVTLIIHLTFGSTTNPGTGQWSFGLPPVNNPATLVNANAAWVGSASALDPGGGHYPGVCRIFSGTASVAVLSPTTSTGSTPSEWNPTRPFTWATGDYFNLEITYETI